MIQILYNFALEIKLRARYMITNIAKHNMVK